MDKTKKLIVVSAVNLNIGGTLTILQDCLSYLSQLALEGNYRIIALVHKKSLAEFANIEYIELPWAKKKWVNRLWCEYVTMRGISKRKGPVYLWLSLHDTTPNVLAERRAVYCHNPFPFYPTKLRDLFLNYKIFMFSMFSYFIYRINIHKNNYLVVQQEWIRNAFIRMFHVKESQIIVANPSQVDSDLSSLKQFNKDKYYFLFPSSANIHKNFETLCEAAKLLEKEIGKDRFQVIITILGDENKYAQWLYKKWGMVSSINFVGFLSKEKLYEYYQMADCLVFPSKVETWGLPISEFMNMERPMLLADLPYAYETAAGSLRTAFFPATDALNLKNKMRQLIEGDDSFLHPIETKSINEPTAYSWQELFDKLLNEKTN